MIAECILIVFFIELYVVLEAIMLLTTKNITPKMYILMHLSTDFFLSKEL